MDASAPPSFLCPFGQELKMRDPVTCADGHRGTAIRARASSIEQWLASHNKSPKTGAVLANNALTPNHALRNSIEEWLRSRADTPLRDERCTRVRPYIAPHLRPRARGGRAQADGARGARRLRRSVLSYC